MVTPVMSWVKNSQWLRDLGHLLLGVFLGALVMGLVVTLCYERQLTTDYKTVTGLHKELYKSASCNTSQCHGDRKGKRQ